MSHRPRIAILIALMFGAGPAAAQQSILANFQPHATTYNEDNAYALAYLSTMVYAQNIAFELVGTDRTAFRDSLEIDAVRFFTSFMQRVDDLIGEGADYTFIRACHPNGYDPEAMVIETSKAIFVVFRGTDRVGCATTDGTTLGDIVQGTQYDMAEWIGTDFDLRQVPFRFPVTGGERLGLGTVHSGFWLSLASGGESFRITRQQILNLVAPRTPASLRMPAIAPSRRLVSPFASPIAKNLGLRAAQFSGRTVATRLEQPFIRTLEDAIRARTAGADSSKAIWVTGHSLGGAHCQLAAMYLKKKGFRIQGVHAFGGPNVGSTELAFDLEQSFPGHRLTRYVFALDPIPTLANKQVGFASAGRVVHFDDMQTRRIHTTDETIISGAGSMLNMVVGGSTSLVPVQSGLEIMCFHYPQWYLHAAYIDLCRVKPARAGVVRSPIPPTPDTRRVGGKFVFDPCNKSLISRATGKTPSDRIREDLQSDVAAGLDAALNFVYDAVFAIGNEIGNPEFEGVYTFECLASKRGAARGGPSTKLIDRDSDAVNLSAAGTAVSDNEFEIRLSGLGGYTIGRPGSPKLVTPLAEGPQLFANNLEYTMKDPEVELIDCPIMDPFCGETRLLPSLEQTWRLYKLREGGGDQIFLIENRAGFKVMDANDGCSITDVKDCKVKQFDRRERASLR